MKRFKNTQSRGLLLYPLTLRFFGKRLGKGWTQGRMAQGVDELTQIGLRLLLG